MKGEGESRSIERMLQGKDEKRRIKVFGEMIESGEKGENNRLRRESRNMKKMEIVKGKNIVWEGRFCFLN